MLRILLPVGISFYTFQAMSYTIDVYRGELRARRSLLDVAVFISFFPHLVAGPIQRASFLLPQVESTRRFSVEKARTRLRPDLLGLLQEARDRRQRRRRSPTRSSRWRIRRSPILWAGVFAFAIQIYADFSAYTDIARGTSRWLGFELTENFDHPYLARSAVRLLAALAHLALDLVPRLRLHPARRLARRASWPWARNVLITFLLSGLWHGASWNYVLWGLYHGLLLILTRAHTILRPASSPRWVPSASLRSLVVGSRSRACSC